jgi:cobalt-zinc-cadmium efflux system outer membrane protein
MPAIRGTKGPAVLRLSWVAPLLSAFCAGCGGPEPLGTLGLDESDRRFVSPPQVDPQPFVDTLLGKEFLTLEDVLAIADRMSPTLAVERKNIDLSTAEIWEAKLYPNPSITVEVEDYATQGGSLGHSHRTAGVRLPVVVGGRVGAATSLAEKNREVAAVQYVWKRRQLLTDVKKAFVSVLAAKRSAELMRETRDLAKTLHDVTQERFKAQAIPELDLLKAAVQLAATESNLKLTEKDLAVSVKSLHALMGNVDFPNEKFAGELHSRFTTPSLESLRGQVTAVHPLLEAAARSREAADLQLSLAKAEAIPDVGVAFSGGKGSDDESILEGGIEIPFPLFNRNQGRIHASETLIQRADLQMQAVRNDLILRLTAAYREFTAAQDRVVVYKEEILAKAQRALDQTHEGYKLGKFSQLDVLDSQRTLAEARTAYAAALHDLNKSAVELELITGTKLEPIR